MGTPALLLPLLTGGTIQVHCVYSRHTGAGVDEEDGCGEEALEGASGMVEGVEAAPDEGDAAAALC